MRDFNKMLPPPKGLEKIMVEKLRKIWDHDEFILGCRILIKTDEERQEIIDAIDDGVIVTSDDMILYALQICKDRGDNFYE